LLDDACDQGRYALGIAERLGADTGRRSSVIDDLLLEKGHAETAGEDPRDLCRRGRDLA